MARYDGVPKVFVSTDARKNYEFFCKTENIFPRLVDLFHFSASVGILLKKRKKLSDRDELVNTYSVDQDEIFETILKEMHPGVDGKTRLALLQEYAEAGIEVIREFYDKHGKLYFGDFFREIGIDQVISQDSLEK